MSDPVSKILDRKERSGRLRMGVGVAILFGLIIVVAGHVSAPIKNSSTDAKVPNSSTAQVESYVSRAERLTSVKLERVSWHKGGFDAIMMLNFTLVNTNAFDIKDVEVTCEDYANSGTLIDRNVRTVYETVKAKHSKTMRDFNMGLIHSQASKTSCSVTAFQP